MGLYLREHMGAIVLSTVLHVAVAVTLTLGVRFSDRPRYPLPIEQVAIEATVVDEAMIQREMERLEQQEQAEILRQQEQARLAREEAEAARRQLEEEQQRLEVVRQERERATQLEEQRLIALHQPEPRTVSHRWLCHGARVQFWLTTCTNDKKLLDVTAA